MLDALAVSAGVQLQPVPRLQAKVARAEIGGVCVVLLQPTTFMNASGEAVRAALRAFRVPLERLLVVVDDLDIPLGSLRLRPKGSPGGHNGLRSISDEICTHDFARLKCGIGRPAGGAAAVSDYVLESFSDGQLHKVTAMIEEAVGLVRLMCTQGLQRSMMACNSRAKQKQKTKK